MKGSIVKEGCQYGIQVIDMLHTNPALGVKAEIPLSCVVVKSWA